MIGSVLRVRYELLQQLGETPLFHVYAAKDRVQARDVCVRLLKQPFDSETEFIGSLTDAVTRASAIQHASLERLYEVDKDEKAVFLVSELSRGTSLTERLRKLGNFSVPVAVATAISLAEGLQALHSSGIAHGDIGAHNVQFVGDGEAKLQLPGIWQSYSSSASAGAVMLPLMSPYLAPEISKGGMPNPQSDVYSLGVLLYEMLSGRYPFHADTAVAMALKHATDQTPNVRMLNPSVPNVLAEIVKKAMSKDAALRYKNGGDMLSDLRILQDALRFGRPLSWPIRPDEPVVAPQVAPKMSAVRPEKKPKERKVVDPEEEEADVPVWIKTAIAFFAGLCALLVIGWVVFNLKKPKLVTVPDLKSLSVIEANSKLEDLGLKMRITRQPHEKVLPEHVIETNPAPEDRVYEGSAVTLVVSAGSQFVEVPDVRGISIDSAKQVLKSVNLELDDRVEEVRSKDHEVGMIVSQVPEPRIRVERLTPIRVKISSGNKPPTSERDPKANTKYNYTVRIALVDIEDYVNLRVDMTDARGTRTVHEGQYDVDDTAVIETEGYGSEVTFRIFYDGELVKQVVQRADESTEE